MSEAQPSMESAPRPEATGTRIKPVLDALQGLPYDTVKPRLEAKMKDGQAVDPDAGIFIVPADMKPIVVEGRTFNIWLARVLAGTYVNPHVHPPKGQEAGQTPTQGPDDEPYFFFSGGEMNTAQWQNGEVRDWRSEQVNSGETYIVQPNRVHSLRNPNPDAPLDFAFACPDDHLQNYDAQHQEGNRIMTVDLPNGMPPSYPQK